MKVWKTKQSFRRHLFLRLIIWKILSKTENDLTHLKITNCFFSFFFSFLSPISFKYFFIITEFTLPTLNLLCPIFNKFNFLAISFNKLLKYWYFMNETFYFGGIKIKCFFILSSDRSLWIYHCVFRIIFISYIDRIIGNFNKILNKIFYILQAFTEILCCFFSPGIFLLFLCHHKWSWECEISYSNSKKVIVRSQDYQNRNKFSDD